MALVSTDMQINVSEVLVLGWYVPEPPITHFLLFLLFQARNVNTGELAAIKVIKLEPGEISPLALSIGLSPLSAAIYSSLALYGTLNHSILYLLLLFHFFPPQLFPLVGPSFYRLFDHVLDDSFHPSLSCLSGHALYIIVFCIVAFTSPGFHLPASHKKTQKNSYLVVRKC